jgi:hypothetical protein
LVTLWMWVEMPLGRASSSPALAVASMSTFAALMAFFVKSLVSLLLSQCGWCLLKSPSQMTWAEPWDAFSRRFLFSFWNLDSDVIVLLWSQSL